MSSETSIETPVVVVDMIYEKQLSSSEEPPMDEWSSLDIEMPEDNIKRQKYVEGLYEPGSGEICGKYIPMSSSSVFRHVYYNYPAIHDPGIEDALLKPEPRIKYPLDGRELYLALCKESDLCPVRAFHRELIKEKIDLKYYGINPNSYRPMAMALKMNMFVKNLDLTENRIGVDGCFHLGDMLRENITITEMNLTGCRIGAAGAKNVFAYLHLNNTLNTLNLSKNELGDKGVELLAFILMKGSELRKLNLSSNNISGKCLSALAEAFEANNITHLDMSLNKLSYSPNELFVLCTVLSSNQSLEALNLSWNYLNGHHIGNAIKILLANPKIRILNLSNNNLMGEAIKNISINLRKAQQLETLDLSHNPLSPEDAKTMLERLRNPKVKLKRLILDNVIVDHSFMKLRDEILSYPFRSETDITWGGIRNLFVCKPKDMREIIFDRCEAICKRSKKRPIDIALVIQQIYKEDPRPIGTRVFAREVRSRGAQLDDDLIEEMAKKFPGPRDEKMKLMDLDAIIDYLHRKWPERKLPPTPPYEPEPTPILKKKGNQKKAKKNLYINKKK